MTEYTFSLILAGKPRLTDELCDRLCEAGCDDGMPFSRDGLTGVTFTRSGMCRGDVLDSAVADIERAGEGVHEVWDVSEKVVTEDDSGPSIGVIILISVAIILALVEFAWLMDEFRKVVWPV